MKELYIILCVAGWVWCLAALTFLAVRLRRGRRGTDAGAAATADDAHGGAPAARGDSEGAE
jgi:hypothetical protein